MVSLVDWVEKDKAPDSIDSATSKPSTPECVLIVLIQKRSFPYTEKGFTAYRNFNGLCDSRMSEN